MEEADTFIKEACKHIGCSFADESDIDFTTPQIFEFLIRCIWKIDKISKNKIPSHVYPNAITSRLHLGNTISTYLQQFHIRGDIALHTVLYGNINNLRSAFIELIRKLPTDTHEKDSQDKQQLLFENALKCWDSQPKWVPVYCRGLHKRENEWVIQDNQPEKFPLYLFDKSSSKMDSRRWICQYLNSHSMKPQLPSRNKPALPPKPSFAVKEGLMEQKSQEECIQNDSKILQEKYDEKVGEYQNLENLRNKTERQNLELTHKLSQFDPELIEALENPEMYAEQLLNKMTVLSRQIEEDTLKIEEFMKIAAQKKAEKAAEMKKMGIQNEDRKRIDEMAETLKTIDSKIDHNRQLTQKLKKLNKTEGDNIYEYEKRSRDLDEMVRKQENDMLRMQDERMILRKQEERENVAVNRSFAIIYNMLLQHCESYRGRLAMESFTRIHLYCMEIMEMLRENGTLKQAVNCLENEIYVEEQKQFDQKCELLSRDLQEVADLNNTMVADIRTKDPSFASNG